MALGPGVEARRFGGDVERDAALAGPYLLRSASGGADRRRLRRFRRGGVQAVLRGEDGGAIGSARPVLPDAHGRLCRGSDSERGIEWRCADSLSLRDFLRLQTTDRVPDHSWLSKTRSRLPHEVHEEVFGW